MPVLEATRKPQKESLKVNKEQQSPAFTIPYTYRKLFGGGIESFRDPFSRTTIRSDQKTELHVAEDAFSLPKNPGPLRKLCHSLGITPPVSKEDIPEFIKSQLAEIKDSEGNNHFENPLISLLFPPPGKEHDAINAIQAADAPENPDSCSEITVDIKGETLEAHAHGSYEGNNKSRIALFALLGHKPSIAFLAKWVEKDMLSNDKHSDHHDHEPDHHSDKHEDHGEHESHAHHEHDHEENKHEHEHDHHDCGHDHSQKSEVTFSGSPEEIVQQVATVISHRLEAETHHDSHKESVESVELSQEERIDSVASITIAHVISPEDKDIEEAFEQVVDNNYIGELNLSKKEPEPLQQENEALTEHFITTLKILREEGTQEAQDEQAKQKKNRLITLSLARLHDKKITMEDILADNEYPPKDKKTAAIMLANAIEVATRPRLDQQNLPKKEKKQRETAIQLRTDFGVSFINYTTNHDGANPFHKIVKPNGKIDSCPDHAKEATRLDQKLRESQKTVRDKLKQYFQPRRNSLPKPREMVRGGVQKTETSRTQLTRPALETLVALGNTEASEKLQSLEKQEAWEKRFTAAAEIIYGAVLVRNEATQELVETLMEDKFFGEITEDHMVRKPAKAIREANEGHTQIFKEKLAEARKEKPVDSQMLALTLAKMHDPTIDTLTLDDKLPEYTQLTRSDVIKILALNMARQTEPDKKPQTALSKKIARYARRINEEKGVHYVNLTMNHATSLHLVETIKGGVEACPDHTQQVDKKLEKMQNIVQKQVAQMNQLSKVSAFFRPLPRILGGGDPRLLQSEPRQIIRHLPTSPSPDRPGGRSQRRAAIPERKERPVSFRPPTKHDRRPKRHEQSSNVNDKPDKKKPQQLSAFVQRVAGGTDFVPSYFKKVDSPSTADFRFTVSAPVIAAGRPETRIVKPAVAMKKPAVFLQPASSGRPPEGARIVKTPEAADRVEYVAASHPVGSTSAESHSQIAGLVSELGKPVAIAAERAPVVSATEKNRTSAERNNTSTRSAKDILLLSQVRATLATLQSDISVTTPPAQDAKIIPFPSGRVTVSKKSRSAGGQALAAIVSLAEKRDQHGKRKNDSAVASTKTTPEVSSPSQVVVDDSTISRLQLRLVTSSHGNDSKNKPTGASESAPLSSPVVAVAPRGETPPAPKAVTRVVVDESIAPTSRIASPQVETTTEGNSAIQTITVGPPALPRPAALLQPAAESLTSTPATIRTDTASTGSLDSSVSPSPDKPKGPKTLNSHRQEQQHQSSQRAADVEVGQQLDSRLQQESTRRVDANVQEMLQTQEQQGSREERHEEVAQVAKGATQVDKEQKETAKEHEGTNAGFAEDMLADEAQPEVEVRTKTGERAKARLQRTGNKISYDIHKHSEQPAEEATDESACTSAPTAQINQNFVEQGTNEDAKRADIQHIAPVIPLSSRRRNQQRKKSSSHATSAQVAASDGYYLPMDPFGAKDAFRQAFAEIA